MLGPPLTTIGQKLSRAQLYEAILKPNAGILMGYESWVVKTKKGDVVSGLKTSKLRTPSRSRTPTASTTTSRRAPSRAGQAEDLDHAGELVAGDDQEELVDLVEYLSTLRNKS